MLFYIDRSNKCPKKKFFVIIVCSVGVFEKPIRAKFEINTLINTLLDADIITLFCFPKNMTPGWAIIKKKTEQFCTILFDNLTLKKN